MINCKYLNEVQLIIYYEKARYFPRCFQKNVFNFTSFDGDYKRIFVLRQASEKLKNFRANSIIFKHILVLRE